jgi:uracil-DNA glycosylase
MLGLPQKRGREDDYNIPEDWSKALSKEIKKDYFTKLIKRIKKESLTQKIHPSPQNWFSFMNLPTTNIKIVIIGQDPYHGPNQAHGLCFSVQKGINIPPSLKNIYKELENDIDGFKAPDHGYLQSWADQGVLLLNATLTVQEAKPNSHGNQF